MLTETVVFWASSVCKVIIQNVFLSRPVQWSAAINPTIQYMPTSSHTIGSHQVLTNLQDARICPMITQLNISIGALAINKASDAKIHYPRGREVLQEDLCLIQ